MASRGTGYLTTRAALVAFAAGTLSACNGFGYISGTYVTLPPQVVTIGCNEPYEVYDRREGRKMLVVSNALREVTGCGLDGESPSATRRLRFSTAAQTFLRETRRDECRVVGETVFSDLQTEFVYECRGGTAEKVTRLPGRR